MIFCVHSADDTATTSFAETPPMSTFILAFFVSDFQYTSNEDNPEGGVRFRIYTPKASLRNTLFKLEQSERIFHALRNYLDLKFTFPKIDLMTAAGINIGSMENWGLIVHSESALLYNDNLHTCGAKIDVLLSTSHEMSHQLWLGNMVTPRWWSIFWINEGSLFA